MVWQFLGVYIINRTLHGRLEIRNFSSRVEKIFHSFGALTREIFSTLEEKFRISARPCNILYISFTMPNITRESILLPVVSIREERIFYTITFTECQKKKNGCQKFTNWYSLTDCKKKTLISTCRSVLVNVFLNNIPNCYKCPDNLEIAKCLLQVLKMKSRDKYSFFMALISNKSLQWGIFIIFLLGHCSTIKLTLMITQ